MTIFFIRHGESESNIRGTVAGARDDCALTEKGIDDAHQAAKNLAGLLEEKDIKIDRVISSPLKRAKKTAEIIVKDALGGISVEIDEKFIERNVGKATGMKTGTWHHLEDDPDSEIESKKDFVRRVGEAIDELRLRYPGENIVIVSHNGVYRAMMTHLSGGNPEEFFKVDSLCNGAICEVPNKKGEEL